MMQNSLAIPKVSDKIVVFLSQQKLSSLLVGLIIFFSATQFGLHLWPLSSLVYGIRVDYLSPTLYFLDCLILLFLGSDLLRKSWPKAKMFSRTSKTSGETRSDPQSILENWRIYDLRLLLPCTSSAKAHEKCLQTLSSLGGLLLTNLLYSQNPLATLSWSLHLVLYLTFFATLSPQFRSFGDLQRSERQIGTSVTRFENWRIYDLRFVLTLSLYFQTIISILQLYFGHSLGGLLYYLGERTVSVGSPGIALATIMDHVILRAYGTFSHPNILAGYSVISLLIILLLHPATPRSNLVGYMPNQKSTMSDPQSILENWRIYDLRLLLPLLLTALLVLLTQSRSAAISLFCFIIPIYFFNTLKSKIIYFIFILIFIFQFSTLNFISPPRSDLSFSQRFDLQRLSLKVILSYPIFGTGAQSSISTYPSIAPSFRLLQPDHNSFTLFLSWFGLVGLLVAIFVVRPQFENWRIYDLRFVAPLLLLLLFDHYLLTSPQGLFIFIFYLLIAVNYSHAQKNL